jgi:hypothetical protein
MISKQKPWTADDDAMIHAWYSLEGAKFCGDEIGRSAIAVGRRARQLKAEGNWPAEAL